jgi:hypothetical protein
MFEEQTGNTRELNEAMTRQINQNFLKELEH